MTALRLGTTAFVVANGEVIVIVDFDTCEQARQAVADFNAGRHEVLGRGY